MFPQPNVINRATTAVDEGLRQHMLRVYNTMILGMLLTGGVAWYVSSTPEILQQVAGFAMPLSFLVLGMSIAFGFLIHKMSVTFATAYFYTFAAAMGAMVSLYMAIYTGESVARAFFAASALFGAMSLYGYTTKKNLQGWGSFLGMGMLAVIVVSLVNVFFFKSTAADLAVSAIVVFLSAGITAYSTQEIRASYYESNGHETNSKMAIAGALGLYVNFINMFLALLRLFGDRR
ncbi:MAG: Bax inhibitor-1 family protein, partial [Holosporales bacterium]|jgi:FtsH-binding integral membrane protein